MSNIGRAIPIDKDSKFKFGEVPEVLVGVLETLGRGRGSKIIFPTALNRFRHENANQKGAETEAKFI